jgi:hypothetical protein
MLNENTKFIVNNTAVGGDCVKSTATAATGTQLFNACRQLTLRYTKQNCRSNYNKLKQVKVERFGIIICNKTQKAEAVFTAPSLLVKAF